LRLKGNRGSADFLDLEVKSPQISQILAAFAKRVEAAAADYRGAKDQPLKGRCQAGSAILKRTVMSEAGDSLVAVSGDRLKFVDAHTKSISPNSGALRINPNPDQAFGARDRIRPWATRRRAVACDVVIVRH
jgi:hypothetical protein